MDVSCAAGTANASTLPLCEAPGTGVPDVGRGLVVDIVCVGKRRSGMRLSLLYSGAARLGGVYNVHDERSWFDSIC